MATRAEKQSIAPSKYVLSGLPNMRKKHTDGSMGIMADSFGAPAPELLGVEDALMLRTTVISKCGRTERVLTPQELHKLRKIEPLPPAPADNEAVPRTQYLHRVHRACQPIQPRIRSSLRSVLQRAHGHVPRDQGQLQALPQDAAPAVSLAMNVN
jgi:hypothetical protein